MSIVNTTKKLEGANTSLKRSKTSIVELMNQITKNYGKVIDNLRQYDSNLLKIIEMAKNNHLKSQDSIEKETNEIVNNNTKTVDDATDLIYAFVQSLKSALSALFVPLNFYG